MAFDGRFFGGHCDGAQVVPTTTWAALEIDQDNVGETDWRTAIDTVTVPVKGLYLPTGYISTDSVGATWYELIHYFSFSPISFMQGQRDRARSEYGMNWALGGQPVLLSAGATVQYWFYHVTGANRTLAAGSHFMITLLREVP